MALMLTWVASDGLIIVLIVELWARRRDRISAFK